MNRVTAPAFLCLLACLSVTTTLLADAPAPSTAPATPLNPDVQADFDRAVKALDGWWPGNGHAYDLVGSSHGLAGDGLTYAKGPHGAAFVFDGVKTMVDVTPAAKFQHDQGVTIAMWVCADRQTSPHPKLLSHSSDVRLADNVAGYSIGFHGVPTLFVGSGGTAETGGYSAIVGKLTPDAKWHHLVASYDLTRMRLYWDGQPVATGKREDYTPPTGHLYLGNAPCEMSMHYQGAMQDVLSFSRALDAREVAALYALQTVRAAPPEAQAKLPKLWEQLAGEDAPQAYAAVLQMTAIGEPAVPFLRGKLTTSPEIDFATVRQWISQLDSDNYKVRQEATRRLIAIGPRAAKELDQAVARGATPEQTFRIEAIRKAWAAGQHGPPPTDQPTLRAMQVLSRLDTPAAQAVLKKFAADNPGTTEAQIARTLVTAKPYEPDP